MSKLFWAVYFLFILGLMAPQIEAMSNDYFWYYFKEGTPEEVQAIINKGFDVNKVNENGKTPLIIAAKWNESSRVIDLLLKAGADGTIECPEGKTAYYYANKNKSLSFSESVFKLYLAMKGGFFYLVIHGSPEEIQKAIEEGSDPNMRIAGNRTALMNAATWNCNPEVIELLIDEGANVNARDDFGGTALREASVGNNAEVVNLLLAAGADINSRDDRGMSSLMYAAGFNQDLNVTKVLLENGASINARSEDGMSALIYAAGYNQNPDVTKVLLEKGANISARNQKGLTALMYAAWLTENPKIIDILLEHGADGTAECLIGKTAIDFAKENEAIIGTDVYWRLHDASFNEI